MEYKVSDPAYPAGVTDNDFVDSGFEEWLESDIHTQVFEQHASFDCEDEIGGEAIATIEKLFYDHGGFNIKDNPIRKAYFDLYDLWEKTDIGQKRLFEYWETL